jgi:hypothetical protein
MEEQANYYDVFDYLLMQESGYRIMERANITCKLTQDYYLFCKKDEVDGLYHCHVHHRRRHHDIKFIGTFDQVIKEKELINAGNNEEIGIISVFGRYNEIINCIEMHENGLSILRCCLS